MKVLQECTVSICLHELHHIISLINPAVRPEDRGSRFVLNTGVSAPEYVSLQPESLLSATWGTRCIVLADVWTEYFLGEAQKHNSVNHFNSNAPINISFLNSHCQLKSQKLSNSWMTYYYNRLCCLWSLSQKILIVKHRINKYMNLPLSRVI